MVLVNRDRKDDSSRNRKLAQKLTALFGVLLVYGVVTTISETRLRRNLPVQQNSNERKPTTDEQANATQHWGENTELCVSTKSVPSPARVFVDAKGRKQYPRVSIPDRKECSLHPCHTPDNKTAIYHYGGGVPIQRDASLRGSVPVITGNVRSGSGCVMSEKYKFIFIHILKSGGITMKTFLFSGLCNTTAGKKCPDTSLVKSVDCRPAIQSHPDYLVWGFIRNPYSRYYSGYAMANSKPFRKDQEFGFENFALQTHQGKQSLTKLHLSHFTAQTSFLFTSRDGGCPAFDFVGRLEHFDEDMATVLRLIQSPELDEAFRQHGVRTNQATAFGSKQKEAIGDTFSLQEEYSNPVVQEKIHNLLKYDFHNFGFDPKKVPEK